MKPKFQNSGRGYTLVELLVAMAVTLVLLAAATNVVMKSMDAARQVSSKVELQANIRVAVNEIVRDLNQSGTGIPPTELPLPSAATGGANPRFGCDATQCYITAPANAIIDGILHKVTPANTAGADVSQPSDAIVIVYTDPTLDWRAFPTTAINATGTTVTMPAATNPPINDPAVGLNVGEVLMLTGAGTGTAVGVVTNFNGPGRTITFANGDPLGINQSGAPVGNVRSIAIPASNPVAYPQTTISRLRMVTYFIQRTPGPDDPAGGPFTDSRLMRQVGATQPIPIAEHIEDLQFSYDIFDDNTGALTVNLPDAVSGVPPTPKANQIRKINLTVTARSIRRNSFGQFDRVSFTTAVGPRNLAFKDRYQ